MATGGIAAGQKRKAASQPSSRSTPKRRKTDIPVRDGASGGLNIANFVKTREFEIKALEASMQKSRKGLMSRAFQQLPRHMRRRTAAHNVMKIPRRLRKRAEREMKVDNTPTVTRRTRPISRKLRLRLETAKLLKQMNLRTKTVRQKMKKESKVKTRDPDPEKRVDVARVPRIKKNKLSDPPKATSKYRRRQVNKTWLPTHLWHTKRAHMTRPTEPLWSLAIPLRPTEKTYRPAHRAGGSRGCLAWDASFVSTVACMGTEQTLENVLTLLGFGCEGNAARRKKWKAGTRHAHGWIHHIDQDKAPIVPATVVWMAKRLTEEDQAILSTSDESARPKRKIKLDRRLFVRVHPSAFQQFWVELLKAAKMQKPQVLVEDLRFEIGSIEITGPGATEALLGVLKPRQAPIEESVEHIWTSLAGLSNPAALPECSLLGFEIIDPRLNRAPKQRDLSRADTCTERLNELIVSWPGDKIQATPTISSHRHRWLASSTLPPQKAINRRKSEAGKGQPIAALEKDPAIPVMLLANRPSCSNGNTQGSWTVLLPWCCTDVVWRSLMHYPLSSGGTPRFGGLNQTRQIAFEQHAAWYPGDFPGTEAGKTWERSEAESRFDEWMRRPPSRRLAWDLVELGLGRRGEVGRGWVCDWEYLFTESEKQQDESQQHITFAESAQDTNAEPVASQRTQKAKKTGKQNPDSKPESGRRRNTSSPESDAQPESPVEALEPSVRFSQLTPSEALAILNRPLSSKLPVMPTLITVRIRLLTKGTPKPSARIYRLPLAAVALPSSQAPVAVAATQASTHPENFSHTVSTKSTPPPSQPSPSTPATLSNHLPVPMTFDNLRERWLSVLPPFFYNFSTASTLPKHSKQKPNHRGLLPQQVVHPHDPPNHIHVLPRNAPQSVIDEFGPTPLTTQQAQEKQREVLMKQLMKNEVKPGEAWDTTKGLVECPNSEDLIGFVTSGAYNLSEGRGTSIGGVWAQRVIEGWRQEDNVATGISRDRSTDGVAIGSSATASGRRQEISSAARRGQNARRRERQLCVVRNAGESVGRLAVWELCE